MEKSISAALNQIFSDKKFYKNTFRLSLPIIIQYLIVSSLNMLDTVMIGKVGEIELASVGIANQYYFLYSLIVMGISSGCAVLISQLWGKRDEDNIRRVLGIGIVSGTVITILFFIIALFVPEKIIAIFNKDTMVINLGADYLKIVCFSYIFTTLSFNYATALKSIENATVPMLASLVGLIGNGFLNYIFIFGKLGLPAMGVKGAALATLIARILELSVLIIYVYGKKGILAVRIKDITSTTYPLFKSLYSIVIPVVVNEACWGLGNVTYSVIYGRIGTKATAAIQICSTIFNFFMIINFALGNASVVIIGKEIGAGREERGKLYAKRICAISLGVGAILSLVLFITSPALLSMFNVSNEVIRSALYILYIYSAIFTIKTFNFIIIVGILRGGGDASYGVYVQAITLWCIGIPAAFIAAFVFKFPVHIVVLMSMIEEMVKLVIVLRRFISNKWIHNVVKDI